MPARLFAESGAPPLLRRERRPVTLSALGTRDDGSVVEMTVVDLSSDGCGYYVPEASRPASVSMLRCFGADRLGGGRPLGRRRQGWPVVRAAAVVRSSGGRAAPP